MPATEMSPQLGLFYPYSIMQSLWLKPFTFLLYSVYLDNLISVKK